MKLSDFKVKSEAEDSYHLMHPSGKTMTVMKGELSPKAHETIKKMCMGGKYADGGNIFDYGQNSTPADVADYTPNQMSSLDTVIAQDAPTTFSRPNPISTTATAQGAAQDSGMGGYPSTAPPRALPAPAARAIAQQPQAPIQDQIDPLIQNRINTDTLLNQQETNAKNYESGLNNAASGLQAAQKDFIQKQAAMLTPQQIADQYKAKDDQFMNHLMETKIDPNRYVKSMSTGSKILSIIGTVLGGAAGGSSGRNPGLDALNTSIGQDIDAQKNDQSNAMNLWKMNRERMRDDMSANLATQNQLLTGVQAKTALAAAQSQSAQAHFNGSQLVNQIEQQKIANRMRLGLLTQGQTPGSSTSGANPLNLVPEMVPAEHQKQAITEIGQSQAAVKNQDQLMKLFDEAAQQTRPTTGRSLTSLMNTVPGYTAPAIDEIKLLADPLLHDNDGKVNEAALAHFSENLPHWGDSDSRVQGKRQAIQDFINYKKSAPTAQTFGINPENFASTSSKPGGNLTGNDQLYYQWAKANPGTEAAQSFFKKHGLK